MNASRPSLTADRPSSTATPPPGSGPTRRPVRPREHHVLDGSVTLAVVEGGTLSFWTFLLPGGEVMGGISRPIDVDLLDDSFAPGLQSSNSGRSRALRQHRTFPHSVAYASCITTSDPSLPIIDVADSVLDTNVLVAALRSRRGASWRILDLVRRDEVQMHVTVPLALEYQDVLLRHRHVAGWSRRETLAFLGLLIGKAQRHKVYYLWRGHAEDPEDAHVLEAAVASGAEFLVTFNTGDLTGAGRFGAKVVTPGAFLRTIE